MASFIGCIERNPTTGTLLMEVRTCGLVKKITKFAIFRKFINY